jgi:hypothetical protein
MISLDMGQSAKHRRTEDVHSLAYVFLRKTAAKIIRLATSLSATPRCGSGMEDSGSNSCSEVALSAQNIICGHDIR